MRPDCYPGLAACASPEPTTELALSQSEDWHSLRIGVNGMITIAPGLRLTADMAYLPYVSVSGLDTHHQRQARFRKAAPGTACSSKPC
ncbi:hypothetical protein [Bradyrhizobium sp. CB3481]|uniref:hypothetical protein n=1 Tax=Bradyrhizobium sp. CB3481 TaxID=3039158 RepID=UPI0024B169F8|nr:hypothetical protein [Bradyrhizobium sp. CB3481]WFU14926.1 hypothetical protein QA643_28635 [Bradyrhizobium sp. CB3481]